MKEALIKYDISIRNISHGYILERKTSKSKAILHIIVIFKRSVWIIFDKQVSVMIG